uniref:Uncharacterized protein n=1 Tax=Acrobeloides nanus TaxID=290746 RepID=A0A914E612_9BILA
MPPEQRQQRHVSFAHSEAGDIPARPAHANFYWLAVMALGACLATLLLPTDGDRNAQSSIIPSYIHPTVYQKLVAAYVLGCVQVCQKCDFA